MHNTNTIMHAYAQVAMRRQLNTSHGGHFLVGGDLTSSTQYFDTWNFYGDLLWCSTSSCAAGNEHASYWQPLKKYDESFDGFVISDACDVAVSET